MSSKAKTSERKIVATHRKARHLYTILDTMEAGIVLVGTEVKSLRNGKADLSAGFAMVHDGVVTLNDVHISPYAEAHQFNHEPRRPRRLLLHAKEIRKLFGQATVKGRTLIPLSMYFNARGMVKVELALCQGKRTYDKREALKRRETDRETRRAIQGAHRR